MPTQPIIEAITSVSSAIEQLEAQRDFGDITNEGLESLKVLNTCYELIARTAIIEAQTVIPSEDMIEPGEELTPWPAYMHGTDHTIEDFIFRIVTGRGEISLRSLLSNLINRAKFSDRKLTQAKVATGVGIRKATVSNYLNNRNMTADNLENIINYLQEDIL
jgi:predicted XRE-type DNA-binding protein